jgi:hypothetical protein
MTGRLLVTTPDGPVAPHTHARLTLASGREIRFVDPRRFGRLEFRDLAQTAGFAGPGKEPLTIDADEFAELFRGRRLAIKAALLNQTLLAGVGNIYADESLFRAGIRPAQDGGTADQGGTGAAAAGAQRGSGARDSAGRIVGIGLCGRGWGAGILSTGALRVSADGAAVPAVRTPIKRILVGWTGDALLPAVPAVAGDSMFLVDLVRSASQNSENSSEPRIVSD